MRLFLFLLLAVSVCAQEPTQPDSAGADSQPREESAPAPLNVAFASVVAEPADPDLQLGHPLDPADVATLTGRSPFAENPRYLHDRAMVYVDADWTNRWRPDPALPFSPVIFGHTRGRTVFLVGDAPGLAFPVDVFARPHIFFHLHGFTFISPR